MGAESRQRYLPALRDRMASLRQNAEIGVLRTEVGTEFRSLKCGSHIIFYRDVGDYIIIVRVLHERMDVHRHVLDDD